MNGPGHIGRGLNTSVVVYETASREQRGETMNAKEPIPEVGRGSVANFNFGGKIPNPDIRNSRVYRPQNSRKSKFATDPSGIAGGEGDRVMDSGLVPVPPVQTSTRPSSSLAKPLVWISSSFTSSRKSSSRSNSRFRAR